MYYPAGLAVLSASGATTPMPGNSALWLTARVLLDTAGALFGLYLLVFLGLSLAGWAMRIRRGHRAGSGAIR